LGNKYILVIDEGTTGTRALIMNKQGKVVAEDYTEITQYNPSNDRVEHDAAEIWEKTVSVILRALSKGAIQATEIASIGITNQRATTVIWDRHTGKPIYRAIVWQDTRTADYIEKVRDQWGDKVYSITGWAISPVYSSLMIKWILDEVDGAREKAKAGDLLFGTIDTWLIWNLTNGNVHATSFSNSSVTGSFDIENLCWYKEWLDFLDVPLSLFPEVRDDSGYFGTTDPSVFGAAVSINAAIADQHAALFGQNCHEAGTVKCTHGTGTFLDMNIGSEPRVSKNGINTVIAWKIGDTIRYAMEGYSAVTGSAVQWLRDGAELIESPSETEAIAESVSDNGGVFFVPALAGLSAPYWDSYARGMIIGINRGTNKAHLVRACLEGIVYSTKDFVETMRVASNIDINTIQVDGKASLNNFLMQFQADMFQVDVVRPKSTEATSYGAAFLAGLDIGYWETVEECMSLIEIDQTFRPKATHEEVVQLYAEWERAVDRTKGWAKKTTDPIVIQ
jgi:glycerol kinase